MNTDSLQRRALFAACRDGDLIAARELFKILGPDARFLKLSPPHPVISEGATPLIVASYYGHKNFVQFLQGFAGVDFNVADFGGLSAIQAALLANHFDVFVLLALDPRVVFSLSKKPKHREILLTSAVKAKDRRYLGLLLALWKPFSKEDLNETWNFVRIQDKNDFEFAINTLPKYVGNPDETSKWLYEEMGLKRNDENFLENCRSGRLELVRQAILMVDCNLLHSIHRQQDTPLIEAMKNRHIDVVRFLVSCPQVDTNRSGRRGMTPLMHAASAGPEYVMVLVQRTSTNVNQTYGPAGHTALAHWLFEARANPAIDKIMLKWCIVALLSSPVRVELDGPPGEKGAKQLASDVGDMHIIDLLSLYASDWKRVQSVSKKAVMEKNFGSTSLLEPSVVKTPVTPLEETDRPQRFRHTYKADMEDRVPFNYYPRQYGY